MRRNRQIAVAVVVVLGLVAAACGDADDESSGGDDESPAPTAGSGTPGPNPDLQATDIGVTPTEVHVTIMADVDNPAAPGLFAGSKRGMEAFADHINANGGVAGRTLVVDFVDSKLSPDAAQTGVIDACENSLALVGTSALFLNNVEPLAECADVTGAATGLPDIAVAATTFAHQCSPTTYPTLGTIMECATKDDHPQTYAVPVGAAKWFQEEKGVSQGSWIVSNDIQGTLDATQPLVAAEQDLDLDGEPFEVSATAPQATYAPYVQGLRADGADYVMNYGAPSQLAQAQKEMTIQGVRPEVVACTQACYGQEYLEAAGDVAEGTYVVVGQIPVEEADEVPAVKAMTDGIGTEIDSWAQAAWISGLLFVAAVEAVVEAHGENGLTRANLLAALADLRDFDADGIFAAPSDVGAKKVAPCFGILQVSDRAFERVYPEEPGTLDCDDANRADIDYDNEG